MDRSRPQYPPPFADSERTAVLERDLYHLDSRLTDLSQTVDVAHTRLHALSERIRRAEWQLDATTTSLSALQEHSTEMNAKLPDIEGALRVLKWIIDSLKYLLAAAIFAGAFASGQTLSFLKALLGDG